RTPTRDLDQLSLMDLNRALPFAAFVFVIASAASMGIPGFSGFAAEITILLGAWKTFPVAVWITGAGMVLVAAFTLRALKKSFFGESLGSAAVPAAAAGVLPVTTSLESPRDTTISARDGRSSLEPITFAEKCGAGVLMFCPLAIG